MSSGSSSSSGEDDESKRESLFIFRWGSNNEVNGSLQNEVNEPACIEMKDTAVSNIAIGI